MIPQADKRLINYFIDTCVNNKTFTSCLFEVGAYNNIKIFASLNDFDFINLHWNALTIPVAYKNVSIKKYLMLFINTKFEHLRVVNELKHSSRYTFNKDKLTINNHSLKNFFKESYTNSYVLKVIGTYRKQELNMQYYSDEEYILSINSKAIVISINTVINSYKDLYKLILESATSWD